MTQNFNMDYNLFSPFGQRPLNYPHYTNWDVDKGIVHLVTQPDSIIAAGDSIFVGVPFVDTDGKETFSYYYRPAVVIEVLETRPAKGDHKIPFAATYQRVSIL